MYNSSVTRKKQKTMDTKFVDVQAVFADAEKRHLIVMLDGKDYWVKRDETHKCWDLEGRKCPWATVYDEDLEDGSFYERFEVMEYYG